MSVGFIGAGQLASALAWGCASPRRACEPPSTQEYRWTSEEGLAPAGAESLLLSCMTALCARSGLEGRGRHR